MKISIVGAGAFGSAIASIFAKGGHSVKLFSPTNFEVRRFILSIAIHTLSTLLFGVELGPL